MMKTGFQLFFLVIASYLTCTSSQESEAILDPPIQQCECVLYYLCNDNSTINVNEGRILNMTDSYNECESYLETCCLPQYIKKVHTPVIRQVLSSPGCGYRNPDGIAFLTIADVNDEAKFGEFPWMAAIFKEEKVDSAVFTEYQCGGSLIHPRVVLTAAHCVSNKNVSYMVRAGEWDTQTTDEILKHQDRKVKSVIIHPDLYIGMLHNDIALLILENEFELGQHIDTVCLPSQGTVTPDATNCWATGWGKDSFGGNGKHEVILKKQKLPFFERNTCQNSLRTTRLGRHFVLHNSFVCAGGEIGIKNTCKGDGCSPLVCPIEGSPNRYHQVGIGSWRINCGEKGILGVYANVALFRDWIDDELAKENLETSQYRY